MNQVKRMEVEAHGHDRHGSRITSGMVAVHAKRGFPLASVGRNNEEPIHPPSPNLVITAATCSLRANRLLACSASILSSVFCSEPTVFSLFLFLSSNCVSNVCYFNDFKSCSPAATYLPLPTPRPMSTSSVAAFAFRSSQKHFTPRTRTKKSSPMSFLQPFPPPPSLTPTTCTSTPIFN